MDKVGWDGVVLFKASDAPVVVNNTSRRGAQRKVKQNSWERRHYRIPGVNEVVATDLSALWLLCFLF